MLKDEVEFLLEEKDKLEHDLNIAVLDLSNIRALNEAAMLDNIKHDENLATHQKVLEDLKTELPLELDLINLERSCSVNKFEFDQEIDSIVNRILSIHVDRLHEVVNESVALKEKISKIQLSMHTSQLSHVDNMHAMNKELLKKRQNFEESFRSAVNRAYSAHLEKAQTELSDSELTHLNAKANILNELDIQMAGIKCLRDAIAGHEEELIRLTRRISSLRDEANSIRDQIHIIRPPTTTERDVPCTSPQPSALRLNKIATQRPRRKLSQSLNSLNMNYNHADENVGGSQPDDEEMRLMEWRKKELGSLLDEIQSFKVAAKLKSNACSPSPHHGVDAFRRLKALVAIDVDFSDAIRPLLRHISLIATADDLTSIEDNVIGWLAYKV